MLAFFNGPIAWGVLVFVILIYGASYLIPIQRKWYEEHTKLHQPKKLNMMGDEED